MTDPENIDDPDIIAIFHQVRGLTDRDKSAAIALRDFNGLKKAKRQPPPSQDIVLRFSEAPPGPDGFVFGTGRKRTAQHEFVGESIASRQFEVTFDQNSRRLKIRGLSSTCRMEVLYDDRHGHGPRGRFDWVLNGPGRLLEKTQSMTIRINEVPYFKIRVHSRDISSESYMRNVDQFFSRLQPPVLLDSVKDTRHVTDPPSDSDSENESDMTLSFIQEESNIISTLLTEGGRGAVTYHFNVSTGEETVQKRPTQKSVDNDSFNPQEWSNEARLLIRAKHPRIIKLISHSINPPMLELEYAPGGSLATKHYHSLSTVRLIMTQILEGIAHMHNLNLSIAHRDLKPENILIMGNDPVRIKICDLGFSKDEVDLVTKLGTCGYKAPELYDRNGKDDDYFTKAQDMWSLGMTGLALLHELKPSSIADWRDSSGTCFQKILQNLSDFVQNYPGEPLAEVLQHMLVMNLHDRWTAQECLDYLRSQEDTTHGAQAPSGHYIQAISDISDSFLVTTETEARPSAVIPSGSGDSQKTIQGRGAGDWSEAGEPTERPSAKRPRPSIASGDAEQDTPQKRANQTEEMHYRVTELSGKAREGGEETE